MPRYRLFATDLDGTLFGHDMVISPRNRAAIQSLAARGVPVVLATGRMVAASVPVWRELGLATPLITYQGAVIHDVATGTNAFHQPLAAAHAEEALSAMAEAGLHANVYVGDRLYVRDISPETAAYMALVRVEATACPNFADLFAESGPTKLMGIGEPERVAELVEVLAARFAGRLNVMRSQPNFLEIVHVDVCKGDAVRRVAAALGIAPAEVVATGDGHNDVGMLRMAGLGAAVTGASPLAIAASDRVIPAMADDGVAVLIESLVAEGAFD